MAAEPRTMPHPTPAATPSLGSDLPRHAGLRLGFLTRLEVGEDAADSYRFALEMFAAAEELGYDVGWIAQHHFLNGDGRLPSVFPFLAAAAQRTRRIQLGTGVVTLPLDDPLRVAEDAAFVDTVSGGRLQLGLGTGGDPLTFSAFGLDVDARRERYAEGFRILQDALAGRPINGTEAVLYPPAPTLPERHLGGDVQRGGRRPDRPARQRPAAGPHLGAPPRPRRRGPGADRPGVPSALSPPLPRTGEGAGG